MLKPIFKFMFKTLLVLIAYATLPTYLYAETMVEVVDQHGNKVSQAVVSIPLSSPPLTSSSPNHAIMDQVNKQFTPQVLIINKNDWVTFPNSDETRHHVYSFSKPKPFEIRLYKGSEASPVQFDQPGIVVLGCNIHDKMVGYIYVADHEATAITNNEGFAKLRQSASSFYVWHPRLSITKSNRQAFEFMEHQEDNIQRVVLNLLPVKPMTKKSGFKSRKFSSERK